ncbi:tyrosine-type recombinase/integrase [Dehalobacterium formicoaceticum]|uniref:tyrosine-type recombinase/integrase n=1 Tax=Dehalobacterium formicoaceticum TaxID=51515 RepID=UPI000B7D4BC3|nr:tyrosine-type recombinase/integrase [Dehalobacterium formicoaceticum]
MAGTINPYRGKKDEWLITVEAGKNPGTGKRQRIKRVFNGGIRAAEKELKKLEQEVEDGIYIDTQNITLGEYLRNWLDDYGSLRLAPTTLRRYRQIITGRVIPKMGAIPLAKLSPVHLQRFYREIIEEGQLPNKMKIKKEARKENQENKPISHATIVYHHRVIHKALDTALKQQLILTNPADAVEIPKPPAEIIDSIDDDCDLNETVKVLSSAEVTAMLEAAKNTPDNKVNPHGKIIPKTRVKNNDYYPILFTAIRTGLRRGELLGLKWSDVSFREKTLKVVRALAYVPEKGIFFKVPKTKESRRKIDISDEVVNVLKEHRKDQAAAKLFWGEKYSKDDLIFCQDDGKPMHPDTISGWFPEYLEQIGLPRLNFHCLRHTHASLMLHAGVDAHRVSKRLGHSSIRITLDIYGHLMPGQGADAVEKFESLFR